MAWCVLIGVCLFLIVMFLITVIFSDVCRELNYNPGMLELIQTSAEDYYSTLSNVGNNLTVTIVNSACSELHKLCPTQPDLCLCNATVFPQLPNRKIEDSDGSIKTVSSCAKICVDSDLKNITIAVIEEVQVYVVLTSVLDDVNQLVLGIVDPQMKAILAGVVCDTDEVTMPLWAACGLVLFAVAFLGVTLLVVDRAVWCFKDPYWNSDAYHEML